MSQAETNQIGKLLEGQDYVAGDDIAMSLHLARALDKPLLVEGPAGVGKTEIAKVMARALDTELIRLQCYEGLDMSTSLYEWNYQRQLLQIRMEESKPSKPLSSASLSTRHPLPLFAKKQPTVWSCSATPLRERTIGAIWRRYSPGGQSWLLPKRRRDVTLSPCVDRSVHAIVSKDPKFRSFHRATLIENLPKKQYVMLYVWQPDLNR